MIPYDIDPSLHDNEPAPAELGDGFSPPEAPVTQAVSPIEEPAELIGDKSPF